MDRKEQERQLIEECPADFRETLEKAISFAKKEYGEKARPSGDKYIDHNLNVALILQKEGFDMVTIIGGLLHHIQIDKGNLEYVSKNISEDVSKILETYSKADEAVKSTDSSFTLATRYILNFTDDLRPVLIQIFNALSNSQILESIENDEERKGMVQRNLNIYSNLAEYLGFDNVKTAITEEAFRITQKEDFEYIENLYRKQGIDKKLLKRYQEYIEELLAKNKGEFKIKSRIKSKYSTFNKLKKYIKEGMKEPVNSITDLIGFRILADTPERCFDILEPLWDKGEIVLEEFDDYISHPKPNGYKAIQGPFIFKEISDMMIEIQILTQEMYNHNTYGPASHIAYKESKSRFAKPSDKYSWIKDVHLAIKNNKENSNKEFSIPVEVEIFPEDIYALTPKGRIIDLSKGDTVTDFAYLIHTDIGNSMIGAKVNNKSVSFDYELETGDVIEIIIQKGKKHPKPNLLRCANSHSTKAKIERAIK